MHGLKSIAKDLAVGAITIADQVDRCRLPGESLSDLLGGPLRGRMCSHLDVDDVTACVMQDDEDEQNSKGEGRNDEEVDTHQEVGVVSEKGSPAL